jgi:hypothetical protein
MLSRRASQPALCLAWPPVCSDVSASAHSIGIRWRRWGVGMALVAGGWLLNESWGAWIRSLGAVTEPAVLCAWLSPFLVVGLALDVGLFEPEAVYGMAPSTTELSAARHSLAQGFLLPLMVSMASRLLPIYSADALRRRGLLELTVDLLMVGALERVGAEMIGGCGECRAARGNWVGAEHLRHSPKALCRVPPLQDVSGLVWSYASSRPDMTWRFFTCECARQTARLT